MRISFRFLIVICLLLFLAAPTGRAQSPTFRGDLYHTGTFDTDAVHRLEAVKWRFETGGPVRSSPAVVDGSAYFGSGDGRVYSVDLSTGVARWHFETGGAVTSSPAVADGTVFFTSRDGKIYSVDAVDGDLRWAYQTGPELPYAWGFDYYTSSPSVEAGIVYAGSGDGHLYALDAETGSQMWSYRAGGRVRSSAAIADGTVYVGDVTGHLHALEAATGAARWIFETSGAGLDPAEFGFDRQAIISSPAVAGDLVIFGGRDGFLYGVERATGRERWRVDHEVSWVISSPAVTNGVVYTGTSDGQFVQAVELETGHELWRTPVRGTSWPSPAVAGGIVYTGSSGGIFYAIEAATGAVLWTFRAGSSFHATPVVANGTVYAGNDDGMLYAIIGAPGPAPLSARPLPRAVYWQERDWPGWFANGRDVYLRDVFAEHGYEVVDDEGLGRFMEARLDDREPGVVVFIDNVVPSTVMADTTQEALIRKFADAGRIVWLSPPPLAWVRDFETGNVTGLDYGLVERVFGIRYPGPDTRGLGGLYGVHVTEEGRRWGLDGWWVGNSSVDTDQVTTVLAMDENGRAGAWLKQFDGPPGTGLLQLWVNRDLPSDLNEIINAAVHGL